MALCLVLAGCVPLAPKEHGDRGGVGGAWGEPPDLPDSREPADHPLFDPRGISEFDLQIYETDWDEALWDAIVDVEPCEDRPYLRANLRFWNPESQDWEEVGEVGVRYRGHSALDEGEHERVGFKIKVNAWTKGQDLHGVERINLLGTEGDYSLMREHLALNLHRAAGVPAPRVSYGWVTVNGEPQGIFPITEEPDDDVFLDERLGGRGSLFKVAGYCGGSGDFEWEGDDPEDYADTYEPKVDTTVDDLESHLLPLIECADSSDLEDCLPDYIDVDEWLSEIAVDMLTPDVDGMAASGQNFMLHRPPGGLFVVYPWDQDQALTDYNSASASIFEVHPTWKTDFDSRIADGLRKHWRGDFCTRVLELAPGVDPTRDLGSEWRELGQHLSPWIEADPFLDWERWTWIADDILATATERHAGVVAEAEGCAGD